MKLEAAIGFKKLGHEKPGRVKSKTIYINHYMTLIDYIYICIYISIYISTVILFVEVYLTEIFNGKLIT